MKDFVIYILLDFKLRKYLFIFVIGILRFSGCFELVLRVNIESLVDSWFINEYFNVFIMVKDLFVFDGCVYFTSFSNSRLFYLSLRLFFIKRR